MQCPACRGVLETFDEIGVELDRCRSCRGVWLDGRELSKLIEARGREFPPDFVAAVRERLEGAPRGALVQTEDREPRHCPRCDVPLRIFNYAYSTGVMVDRCPVCKGIWTDKGEIEQIEVLMSGAAEFQQLPEGGLHDCSSDPFGSAVRDDFSVSCGRRYGLFDYFFAILWRK